LFCVCVCYAFPLLIIGIPLLTSDSFRACQKRYQGISSLGTDQQIIKGHIRLNKKKINIVLPTLARVGSFDTRETGRYKDRISIKLYRNF